MVQSATSAIVATGNCCVCPPVTMMANIPRATLDFAWKASVSKPRLLSYPSKTYHKFLQGQGVCPTARAAIELSQPEATQYVSILFASHGVRNCEANRSLAGSTAPSLNLRLLRFHAKRRLDQSRDGRTCSASSNRMGASWPHVKEERRGGNTAGPHVGSGAGQANFGGSATPTLKPHPCACPRTVRHAPVSNDK